MLLVAIVAGALVLSGDDGEGPAAEIATPVSVEGIPQDGTFLGDPDAPVLFVEYADFQCPFCGDFANGALPELIEDYVRPGQVRLELRGLAFIGEDSVKALRHVLAAAEQDRAWHVAELLFANQGEENSGWVTDDLLETIGGEIAGLDVEQWLEDANSPAVSDAMNEAQQQASSQGVQSTPSFFVGRSGGELEQLNVASLEAESFRPTLDSLVSEG